MAKLMWFTAKAIAFQTTPEVEAYSVYMRQFPFKTEFRPYDV